MLSNTAILPPQRLSRKERRLAKKNKGKAAKSSVHIVPKIAVDLERAQQADEAGSLEVARDLYIRLMNAYPRVADVHFRAGLFFQKHKLNDPAYKAFKNAVTLDPTKSGHWVGLGMILQVGAQLEATVVAFQRASELKPHDYPLLCALAEAYRTNNNQQSALVTVESAISLEPNNAQGHHLRGMILQDSGDFAACHVEYYKTLELDPRNTIVYYQLLKSGAKIENADEVLSKLKEDLVVLNPNDERCSLHLFSIAKLEEQRKNYGEAFQYYIQGNKNAFDRGGYNLARDLEDFDVFRQAYTADVFEKLANVGVDSEQPVFVIGMPRSGTTLVEQVIGCHSQAEGMGELNKINLIAADLKAASARDCIFPDNILRLNPAIFNELGQSYLAFLQRQTSGDWQRIVDKMPHNFLYVGLIKVLFPKASIIHCKRNPLDTCLSNFMTRFPSMEQMGFSYDLDTLGKYYKGYQRLMKHRHDVLPGQIYDVEYEKMVEDPNTVSRGIMQHIGLDWEEGCHEFHKNEGSVQTSSAWQVRQPIYKTSVERWRRYEKHLGPLQDALKHA